MASSAATPSSSVRISLPASRAAAAAGRPSLVGHSFGQGLCYCSLCELPSSFLRSLLRSFCNKVVTTVVFTFVAWLFLLPSWYANTSWRTTGPW